MSVLSKQRILLTFSGFLGCGHQDILETGTSLGPESRKPRLSSNQVQWKPSYLFSLLSYLIFHFSSLPPSPPTFLFYLVSVRNIMLWGRMPNRIRKLFLTTTLDPLPIKRKTEWTLILAHPKQGNTYVFFSHFIHSQLNTNNMASYSAFPSFSPTCLFFTIKVKNLVQLS